jgi:hypothetical protein
MEPPAFSPAQKHFRADEDIDEQGPHGDALLARAIDCSQPISIFFLTTFQFANRDGEREDCGLARVKGSGRIVAIASQSESVNAI